MPIEPAPPDWVLPDPGAWRPGVELVAVGADLSPGMLLAGYRTGLFAMPDDRLLGWWSPDPRGVLLPRSVHVSRSLRRSLRRFCVTVDRRFDEVVSRCADPVRPYGWISAEYEQSYRALHRLGWAHSIEVWDDRDRLAGGLFGVEVGGLFAAESKFRVATDASKVAVIALAELLARDRRIIDVQWRTPHLAAMGVVEVPRTRYLAMLAAALRVPPALSAPCRQPAPGAGPSRIRWRRA